MPLCDTLMRAAEAELYELHFSQQILDGATRNLVKDGRMKTDAKAAYFQEQIKTNFPDAMVEVPESLVAAMTNDQGDHHVVAAAIVSKAEVIVTRTYALYKFIILCINENTSFQAFINYPSINSVGAARRRHRLKSAEKSRFNA